MLESILILAILLRFLALGVFKIPSGSMEPTLNIGDYILVYKGSYYKHPPQRGDVVVFRQLENSTATRKRFFSKKYRYYVKRIIAIPEDVIEIKESQVWLNGFPVLEPYLHEDSGMENSAPQKIPKDSYFVMGDHRCCSKDSRSRGVIEKDCLVGKVLCIYWPFKRIGRIDS